MSKNISQQAIATAECAAAAAARFGLTLTDAQLVEHAAILRQEGADADLRALFDQQGVQLTAAVERLVPSTEAVRLESLDAAAACLLRAQHDLMAESAVEVTRRSAVQFETVQCTRTEEVTTIFATAAHATFMVQVDHRTGEVVRDWQTGPGDACTNLDAEWVAAMAERGIRLATVAEDHHGGRRDGERLIRPALAAAPDQPTVGGVLAFRDGAANRPVGTGWRVAPEDLGPEAAQGVVK